MPYFCITLYELFLFIVCFFWILFVIFVPSLFLWSMKKDDIKQPVRLREKSLKNGVKSLYLDIYQDGQRRYQYLKLYINPGTDPLTKMKNKAAMDAARVIQARNLWICSQAWRTS